MGLELKASIWSFVLGRLYDILGLVLLFWILSSYMRGYVELAFLGAFVLAISVRMVYVLVPSWGRLNELKGFIKRELTIRLSLALTFLSSMSFLLKAFSAYMVVEHLVDIEFETFCLAFAGGELTTVLPFHGFMGYGTYEMGFLLPLKFTGIETEEGLKVGFLVHTFVLVSSSLWGIICVWILHTLSRKAP